MTLPLDDTAGVPQPAPALVSNGQPLTVREHSCEPPQQVDGLEFHRSFTAAERREAMRQLSELAVEVQQQVIDEVAANFLRAPERTVKMRLLRYLVKAAKEGLFTPELCFSIAQQREAEQRQAASKPAVTVQPLTREEVDRRIAAVRSAMNKPSPTKTVE